ncbi:MAG: methyltransferase [Hyphomicrobiaceae bacterium]
MAGSPDDPAGKIFQLGFGYIFSGSLAAAAKLKISDHLTDGPKTPEELAKILNVDALSLFRVLRALASQGIYEEDDQKRFKLNASAELLRSDHPHSLRYGAIMLTQDVFWRPAGEMDDVIRTGEDGMMKFFNAPFFEYLKNNEEAGEVFHYGMSSISDAENEPCAASYDFSQFDTLVDIAGGHGGLLLEALKKTPGLKGVLFEEQHVLDQARIDEEKGRWDGVVGDFFKSVPEGHDGYMMKRILHDWTDEQCVEILKNIRTAMKPDAKLLIFDCVIPTGNDPHPGKELDVLIMQALPGRERMEEDFERILSQAGLKLNKVYPTPTLMSITEAVVA